MPGGMFSRIFTPPHAPPMPPVEWPVAARIVPKLQEVGKGLYEGAYGLGFADGGNLGFTGGIVVGVVATVAVFALVAVIYWAAFRPIPPTNLQSARPR